MPQPIRIPVIPGEPPQELYLRAVQASADAADETYLVARQSGRSDFLVSLFISCAAGGPDHILMFDIEDRVKRAGEWAEMEPDSRLAEILSGPARDGFYILFVISLDHGYTAVLRPAPPESDSPLPVPEPARPNEQYNEALRLRFVVTCETEELATYYRFGWGPWDTWDGRDAEGRPGPARLPADCSIEAVVDDVMEHYGDDFPPEYAGEGEPQNLGGKDLAIWQDGYLAAIIRRVGEDQLEATVFGAEDMSGLDD